jgi:hypothetical protein
MQSDDGLVGGASSLASSSDGVAVNKADALRQLATSNGEGGLVAQLTSNPFFTAVSIAKSRHTTGTEFCRASVLPLSAQRQRLDDEVYNKEPSSCAVDS